jgi:lipopolysaccharide biosynthesis regulator YciM
MSIIYTLKKIIDPIAARQEEAERKAQREEVRQQEAGDPPMYRCRACGLEDSQGAYCPECLADTMEQVAPPRGDEEE